MSVGKRDTTKFYVRVLKAQGATIHKYKDSRLKCRLYFQERRAGELFEKKHNHRKWKFKTDRWAESEWTTWRESRPCFDGFNVTIGQRKKGLPSDVFSFANPHKYRIKRPNNFSIVVALVLESGETIAATRLSLFSFMSRKNEHILVKATMPSTCSAEMALEFWKEGRYPRPQLVRDEMYRVFGGGQKWIESLFLRCGHHVLPRREVLLRKVDNVAIVYGSGASASDHEFPGELWLTSYRLLFFPRPLFTRQPNALRPPFPVPFEMSLAAIRKFDCEKEFECCKLMTSCVTRERRVDSTPFGEIPGYCRARIWGKLPRFCEVRAPGENIRDLLTVQKEITWKCAEGRFWSLPDHSEEEDWAPVDMTRAFVRMGAIDRTVGSLSKSKSEDSDAKGNDKDTRSKWRLTTMNADFNMCKSYPRVVAVPASVHDADVFDARFCRAHHRIPVLSWYDQKSGASLIRSGQPMETPLDHTNSKLGGYLAFEDVRAVTSSERYMDALDKSCDGKLFVADLRPASDALYNACCKRGGWESKAEFQNIWPTPFTRQAFDEVRPMATARNPHGTIWKTGIDEPSAGLTWMGQIRVLLRVSQHVRAKINSGISVLVNCSGGWDRTPQVCSLVQVLADAHCRTIEGFADLINKEWISFGHQFSKRCHYEPNSDHSDSSPIFVQFLDAVSQMIRQRPTSFEYNEYLLVFLAEQCYTDTFGDFVHNSDYERSVDDAYKKTVSVWSYVRSQKHRFSNPLFSGCNSSVSNPEWNVVWSCGPVNVRNVVRGEMPSTKATISRQLRFKQTVCAQQRVVLDSMRNEWIRISPRGSERRDDDLSSKTDDVPRRARSSSHSDEWVCVRDGDGQLLSNGSFEIDADDVSIWRTFFLRWHFRSLVSHPVVRCFLREPSSRTGDHYLPGGLKEAPA